MKKFYYSVVLISLFILILSCQKEEFITDSSARLEFSTDTICFDTIFTTIGSTTKYFHVYNRNNRPIQISSVYIGNPNSYFRMNIDGEQSNRVNNIEIAAKDSLYVFVEVTVDPTGVNNPLVISDSIVFETNGNVQDVNLIAFGQDVHLIDGEIIETTTWINDKPYLIYNSMGVDTGQILTIESGVRLYFHKESHLIVWGTLIAQGNIDEPITFRGDRLDDIYYEVNYDRIPDQWGGILLFPTSKNNILEYCHIKNATIGLWVGAILGETEQAEVNLSNCIIENSSYSNIFAINSHIVANNCLIANAGAYTLALTQGGNYEFNQSTIVNYYFGQFGGLNEPSVIITNVIENDTIVYPMNLEKAEFNNCIVYGRHSEGELGFLILDGYEFNVEFNNSLIKVNTDSIDINNSTYFNDIIVNEDPNFILPNPDLYDQNEYYNFQLDTLSPAKDIANPDLFLSYPELQYDILGNSRLNDAGPDLGVYERKE